MSYYLDKAYLNGFLNRSSYDLRQDYMNIDQRGRRDKLYDDNNFKNIKDKYNKIQNKKYYHDPIVSSFKRDQLFMSKHNPSQNKSSLISTQISSKKYPLQNTSLYQHSKKPYLSSYLSQSSILYPYTYTEYSLMKSKIQQKKIAQDKWLQSEIQRIKTENLLFDSKYSTKTKQTYTTSLKIQQKINNKKILSELKQSKFHPSLSKTENPYHYKQIQNPKPQINQKELNEIKTKLHQNFQQIQKRNENTFLYDDLKQSNSDYQEETHNHNQKQQQKIDIQRLYDSRLQKLNLSPQKQSNVKNNRKSLQQYKIKLENEQNSNQVSIKKMDRKQKTRSNTYNKLIIFNSNQNLEQQKGSSCESQTFFENQDQLQYLYNQLQDMEIYKHGSQHYPIFSPLKNHKHLPHNTDQNVSYNTDPRKSAKHYRALEEKKQNEYKGYHNPKSIIVDELQKKKILSKSYDHHTFIQRKLFYEHKRNQENILIDRQHMRNPQIQFANSHIYQLNQSSQAVANGLRVDLEILKQQLDDKNKKVVDLEIQLLQLKSSILLKTFEKKTHQIATETEILSQQKSSQPQILQETSSQTVPIQKNLNLSNETICLKILPSKNLKDKESQLQKQRNMRKKLQQKLKIQQEAMTNFLQDIAIYQNKNKQLQTKIKHLQSQKNIPQNK